MGDLKILVVDDSSMIRKTIRNELEEGGYEVIEAKDGLEGLTRSAEFPPPDLITLDIEMPKLNGFDTCSKLREERYARFFTKSRDNRVPVIFVTSNDTMEDRKKGFNLGATDFLTKPFAKGAILGAVNNILKPITLSQGLTALVVDDSKVSRLIVSDYLKREGLSIIEAKNGVEALEILGNQGAEIDMVITDLEMPQMDGRELTERIRNELDMRDLPIIFLTANPDRSELLEVFKSGATDHLIKPFVKEELLARITAHLERNRLTRQLRGMVNELTGLNLMKDNLLAVCSHDLRSPLNGILGFTDLLLEKDYLESEDSEALTQIKISGNVLMDLINDILDLSKAKAEQVELKMDPILLPEAVQTSVNALKHMAHDKHQQLELTDSCPEAMISGNFSGISRVFNNLLSNAIKFTPENGEIIVEIEPAPEEHVVVKITDTGIGIPKAKIPYLFDQFTNTSQAGTGGEKGTGLGMSIVKEILERHDADIEVISDEGKGTCFKLIFSRITATPEHTVLPETHETGAVESQPSQAPKKPPACRILLAEDNPVNQKLADKFLTKAGHQVEVANNGKEAFEKYTASPEDFDLIFMDVQMPEMNGLEATKEIREWETRNSQPAARIPIIAMTAQAMEGDREICLEAGMDDYVTKPIKKEILFEVLDKWGTVSNHHSNSHDGEQ